ncbi:hypothetical protein K59PH2_LOCUS17 [Klebsiella phage vB_Kpl_K59PH2]|uniref:Uncharacterized protein n=1 Tax=Klebsiella phage vB_Kpl_K59PH2 TaxID=3071671 RepID=A0AAD2GPR1_9CAUD|nr:hypothetical protein K59PH2_LOCUS17 [Klebsiella phage vB_Kpl_K59PH2]
MNQNAVTVAMMLWGYVEATASSIDKLTPDDLTVYELAGMGAVEACEAVRLLAEDLHTRWERNSAVEWVDFLYVTLPDVAAIIVQDCILGVFPTIEAFDL